MNIMPIQLVYYVKHTLTESTITTCIHEGAFTKTKECIMKIIEKTFEYNYVE